MGYLKILQTKMITKDNNEVSQLINEETYKIIEFRYKIFK